MNKDKNLSELNSSINNDDSQKVNITSANSNNAWNKGCNPFLPTCPPPCPPPCPPGPPGPQGPQVPLL